MMLYADVETFTTIAERFGVPLAILTAFALAVWRIGVWLGKNVAKPVADRHIAFLDKASDAISSQATTLQGLGASQSQMAQTLERMAANHEDLRDDVNEIKHRVGIKAREAKA